MKAKESIRKRINAYQHVFDSPDGKAVLADLEQQFGNSTLRKHEGVIDPHASIAAAGCREVLLYIKLVLKQTIEDTEDAVA